MDVDGGDICQSASQSVLSMGSKNSNKYIESDTVFRWRWMAHSDRSIHTGVTLFETQLLWRDGRHSSPCIPACLYKKR